MGMPAARVGDMHVCPMVTVLVPHVGGPILPPGGMPVLIGGMPAARVGDMCVCVGPPDVIALGSFTVLIGGMPAAQLGSMCAHGGSCRHGLPYRHHRLTGRARSIACGEIDRHGRDVVGHLGHQRGRDQPLGGGVVVTGKQLCQQLLGQGLAQAVAAQQQPVAGLKLAGPLVQLEKVDIGADGARDDIGLRMTGSFRSR